MEHNYNPAFQSDSLCSRLKATLCEKNMTILKFILGIFLVGVGVYGATMVKDSWNDFFSIFKKKEETLLLAITHLRRDHLAWLNADTLTNIDIYLAVKITNIDDKAIEISDYQVELFSDGIWEKASIIAFLNKNNLFQITNNDYENATRIRLNLDILDYALQNKQIQPGDTITGMVPIETEKKLGKIEKIRFTIKDIRNEPHEFNIKLEDVGVKGKEYLQSIIIEVLDKNIDLSGFTNT